MGININKVQNISIPDSLDADFDKKSAQSNNDVKTKIEYSSASSFYALEGQMRKLQLLQKFVVNDTSNNKITQANLIKSTNKSGGDNELIKESKRIIENYRRQIKPTEISGSQPVKGGKTPGHPYSKHLVKLEVQAGIMNKPDRIFSGYNDNGRLVDIYYKDKSVVITEFGSKERVITAYGMIDQRAAKPKPVNVEKFVNNPRYVEIKLEGKGAANVIYPNETRWTKNDFPINPPKPNAPPKPNGGGSTGETSGGRPTVANPVGEKATAANEPPIAPKVPPANEELPVNRLTGGGLANNINRGVIIAQLIQLGVAVANFSQLKADGEKYGYYVDPFLNKYVLTDPDKAARNLPEGFELKFFFDPKDFYSQGQSVTFTVKDGKFVNTDKNYPDYKLYIGDDGVVTVGIAA